MDQAPRDGSSILCFTEFGEYEISNWDSVISCWISKRGFFVPALRWMPLPKPPADIAPDRT